MASLQLIRNATVLLEIGGVTFLVDPMLDVAGALATHRPDVVVVNAGGARFTEGDPITMTADDIEAVARHAPGARLVAVHLEAVNHCLETRADLHQRLDDAGLADRVTIPEDGALVPV